MAGLTLPRLLDVLAPMERATPSDLAPGLLWLLRSRGVTVVTDGTRVGCRPGHLLDDDDRRELRDLRPWLVAVLLAEARCRAAGQPFADPAVPDPALPTYWRFHGEARTHELRPGDPVPPWAHQWCQPKLGRWVATEWGAGFIAADPAYQPW